MNNIKLAYKLTIGFGIVLLLTALVAGSGALGLGRVVRNIRVGDAANQIVSDVSVVRQIERDFVERGFGVRQGETESADVRMAGAMATLAADAEALRVAQDQDEIDAELASALAEYQAAFERVVAQERIKQGANLQMDEAASQVLSIVKDLWVNQTDGVSSQIGANDSAVQKSVQLADASNQLIQFMLQVQREQMAYVLDGGGSFWELDTMLDDMRLVLDEIQENHQDAESSGRVVKIRLAIDAYEETLARYVALYQAWVKSARTAAPAAAASAAAANSASTAENEGAEGDATETAVEPVATDATEPSARLATELDDAQRQLDAASQEVLSLADIMRSYDQALLYTGLQTGRDALTNRLDRATKASEVSQAVLAIQNDVTRYQVSHDVDLHAQVRNDISGTLRLILDMKHGFDDAYSRAQADAAYVAIETYDVAFGNYLGAVENQRREIATLERIADTVQDAATQLVADQRGKMTSVQRSASALGWIVALVALVAGVGAALLVTRNLTGPIKLIAEGSRRLSVGDAALEGMDWEAITRLTQRRDELGETGVAFTELIAYFGEMAGAAQTIAMGDLTTRVQPKGERDVLGMAFDRMVANLRDLVGQVIENAQNVGAASEELTATADQASEATQQIAMTMQQVASGTAQQTEGVTQAAGSVDQMVRAVGSVAAGSEEQARAVERSSALTAQMTAAIASVSASVERMDAVRQQVGRSAGRVTEMGARSQEIGAIVNTIDEIARQTRLLALNAAIEAARAGEQGRGFAVVADEVGKLAARAAAATKEISALIKQVQASVNDAVAAMETSTEQLDQRVNEMSAATGQMATSSTELVDAMGSVSAVVKENTASTQEMAGHADQVSQAIESVASISEENGAAAEEVSASVEEMSAQVEEVTASAQSLNQLAEVLQEVVSRFRLGDGEASRGAGMSGAAKPGDKAHIADAFALGAATDEDDAEGAAYAIVADDLVEPTEKGLAPWDALAADDEDTWAATGDDGAPRHTRVLDPEMVPDKETWDGGEPAVAQDAEVDALARADQRANADDTEAMATEPHDVSSNGWGEPID